jgi:hypothetical protein
LGKRYRKGKGKPYKRKSTIGRVFDVAKAMAKRGASFDFLTLDANGRIYVVGQQESQKGVTS